MPLNDSYIRKIKAEISDYRHQIEGLIELVDEYKSEGDQSKARLIEEEIRRKKQMIENLESQF